LLHLRVPGSAADPLAPGPRLVAPRRLRRRRPLRRPHAAGRGPRDAGPPPRGRLPPVVGRVRPPQPAAAPAPERPAPTRLHRPRPHRHGRASDHRRRGPAVRNPPGRRPDLLPRPLRRRGRTGQLRRSMKIGFAGLGVMGAPMARHLIEAGHEVAGFNRSPAKAQAWAGTTGGRMAATVEEAAAGADLFILCVGNDDDVREVVTAALPALSAGAVVVDHTTTSARVAREMAELT